MSVEKEHIDTDLLCDAHVQLKPGVHYGLIGRNGVGKTVLMNCLASGGSLVA